MIYKMLQKVGAHFKKQSCNALLTGATHIAQLRHKHLSDMLASLKTK